ncbi:HAD family hydrolase [Roseicitreum antarcticum]|uniref:Haloacid dehalogenase superfamily, subfamily IA, variant 2 with 3rd motif like haloacid dehalogenase/haloacid dehalogenase superfamily, subfamily IA, variant 3 with third motif having DD or ED n=1 Tax=Roseicitreum antarcticum TaxID=564137 RepID=A0A1H2Z7H1_9RHOB|nr:HAD family phosphatase [Roseicitreum antarcticum]SDX12938.1 Haloacid dehalogenase superfamily, subfamily IA, variant 2 with 3rd motif like haloacid dehalogenase/haloacid dehalogenase superfamily, subfamily IA, variant 3 with third motif having DD or ED [Roseicitreum antarcticum]
MNVQPKALIFDCDGTLLLTADLHFKAIGAALAAQGASISYDWYVGQSGLSRGDLFQRVAQHHDGPLDLPRLSQDSIDATLRLAHDARPNPSVAALAVRLSGKLPLAVATNSERAIVSAFLEATGLRKHFDAVVAREDAAKPKPAPDLFLRAAHRLGVAPESCLILEDSAEGLAAARDAGMEAVDVRNDTALATLSARLCSVYPADVARPIDQH